MEKDHRERRKKEAAGDRLSFGELARVALKLRVRDARPDTARWVVAPNLAWVSWPREDSRHAYAALSRQMDFITGELGFSVAPVDLDQLPQVAALEGAPRDGCRIQLGSLLHGRSQTWAAGGSEKALIERLDWIAQQLHLRLYAFMASTAPPAR